MESVVLVIHLVLALGLIGIVLMQRSEGGGLGIGSGGAVASGRSVATAMGKLTWIIAVLFILTSVGLTIIAKNKAESASAMDTGAIEAPAVETQTPAINGADLLPPSASDASPLLPSSN